MTETSSLPPPTTPVPSTSHANGQGPMPYKDLLRFEAEKKSPGVAFALCCIWGLFGAHRFYMKRTGSAVAMLAITLVSAPLCLLVVGFVGVAAIWIWVIVDLFSVTGWVREYNAGLLARITSGGG